MTTRPSKQLDTFPNPKRERDYHIAFECPEFTCLCPMTGQPDFATILIDYVPDELCVELKSLKLYLWSYRDEGAFHEAVTNRICDDLVAAIAPRSVTVTGKFWVRCGSPTARGRRSPRRREQQLVIAQRALGERGLAEREVHEPGANEGLIEAERGHRRKRG